MLLMNKYNGTFQFLQYKKTSNSMSLGVKICLNLVPVTWAKWSSVLGTACDTQAAALGRQHSKPNSVTGDYIVFWSCHVVCMLHSLSLKVCLTWKVRNSWKVGTAAGTLCPVGVGSWPCLAHNTSGLGHRVLCPRMGTGFIPKGELDIRQVHSNSMPPDLDDFLLFYEEEETTAMWENF